ncbi:NmrA family NAD(P)-binding protein [Novosphingobium sp. NDB2Meth1]|uniref:NmrA family NAD(P)-binding protein n=1 Tax=Novosphingobium sp. NDB2Meth1 TaxID=1892847 RepID=UPI000930240C|nr:NmrA family NAD(P)-binding protein [Novosphingobium sp. NDB2Meth1]
MAAPLILVSGATGGVGQPLVADLLARGLPVRALVRRHDARSAALVAKGAEIVTADLFDADQLADAMKGVRRAFYLPPMRPHMMQSAVAFALAAKAARVEHVVSMSQWTSHRAHPANMTRQTWLNDGLFDLVPGAGHTVFNPGMFAHNFLRTIDFAALLGFYPVLSGKGRAAPVSNEDMARTAAVILAEGPERHAGKRYRPTGPELLDGREMAAVIARVVGHGVLPFDMPFWLFAKAARLQGVDPYEIASLSHYLEDMRAGTFAFEGGVTDVVEALTGTPAESFEATARRYAALPFARQTLANRLKAFVNFNRVPFQPGVNVRRLERRLGVPELAEPSLAVADPVWRQTHAAQMAGTSALIPAPRLVRRA